ncbi:MAG: hypothetical protein ABIQ16_23885 [Polyangiaceae bacterium]
MLKLFCASFALALTAFSPPTWAQSGEAVSPDASREDPSRAEVRTSTVNSTTERGGRTDAPQAHEPHKHWYGWQVMTADLAAASILMTGVVIVPHSSTVALVLGAGVFIAAPPAIHFAHGRVGAGLGSLGLRLALPTTFGLLGRTSCNPRDPGDSYRSCQRVNEALYGIVGMVVASIVDAAALSTEELSADASAARVSFSPVLSGDGKRAELRLAGSF